MTNPHALTNERKSNHGDWHQQASLCDILQQVVRTAPGWAKMPAFMRVAIDMILVKISRIVCGDPTHADHWDDIAGYSFLGKGGHKPITGEGKNEAPAEQCSPLEDDTV